MDKQHETPPAAEGKDIRDGRILDSCIAQELGRIESIVLAALSKGNFGETLKGLNRIQLLSVQFHFEVFVVELLGAKGITNPHPVIVALMAELKHAQTTML
ncbi:MAG: hypothetical protein WCT53_04560 [Candidatus Gracilibacteria bacterium]